MTVTNEKALEKYWKKHADAKAWLQGWLMTTKNAKWQNIQDVKKTYPATDGGVKVDSGGTMTVFDVCGNNHRLIAAVGYKMQTVAVLEVMTHPEYSKNLWKGRH